MSTSQRTMTVFGRRAEAPAIAAVARPRTPTPGGVEGGVEDMGALSFRSAAMSVPRSPVLAPPAPVLDRAIPRLDELSAHAQAPELASGR